MAGDFEKFTQQKINSLINHLKKYDQNGDSETLHQIRVDIKKIKAVIEAINGCVKGFKAHKNFIPFRSIFRRAGAIREPEVLARLLLQYKVEGITPEQKPVEQLAVAFHSNISHFLNVVEKGKKNLKAFSKQVNRDDLKGYLASKKKKVKSQLYPRPKMATMHKVRKSVKEIIYLSEVGGKLKRKEAKFNNKMQDIIGRLHDKQVLLDLFKNNSKASHILRDLIKLECITDKKEIFILAKDYYEGR